MRGSLSDRREPRRGGRESRSPSRPSSLRAGAAGRVPLPRRYDAALKKAEADALINPKGAELFHTIALAIENKFRYRDCVRFGPRPRARRDYWPAYVTLGINCLRTGERRGRIPRSLGA